jgi:Haemolymph juvenile hormone binding protein (JHBP)
MDKLSQDFVWLISDALDWAVHHGLAVAAADRRTTGLSDYTEAHGGVWRQRVHGEKDQVSSRIDSQQPCQSWSTLPLSPISRLSQNDKPFEARITIPKLTIKAKYASSGVLIIIPASGNGEFDAIFGKRTMIDRQVGKWVRIVFFCYDNRWRDSRCEGKSFADQQTGRYLHESGRSAGRSDSEATTFECIEDFQQQQNFEWVDQLVLKFSTRDWRLFFSILPAEATNLFLKENGGEVLNAMKPQLQKKLSTEFAGIANALLKHVPIEKFLVD